MRKINEVFEVKYRVVISMLYNIGMGGSFYFWFRTDKFKYKSLKEIILFIMLVIGLVDRIVFEIRVFKGYLEYIFLVDIWR